MASISREHETNEIARGWGRKRLQRKKSWTRGFRSSWRCAVSSGSFSRLACSVRSSEPAASSPGLMGRNGSAQRRRRRASTVADARIDSPEGRLETRTVGPLAVRLGICQLRARADRTMRRPISKFLPLLGCRQPDQPDLITGAATRALIDLLKCITLST